MKVDEDFKLDFSDVLIKPQRSTLVSRKDVDLKRTFTFKHSKQTWHGIPIMASNMDGVGTIEMAKTLGSLNLMTALTKDHDAGSLIDIDLDFNRTVISTGIGDEDYSNLLYNILVQSAIKFICVDVANGYTQAFAEYVSKLREKFPDKIIIAGNVVTGDMTEELIFRGADIVKVGIGPGSVCTTRIQTGVGYPQLSAIMECAEAAHRVGGHIMADGGCVCPGDVAKAFGAGADFVMLGGMLAGHDEGLPDIGGVENGKVKFYGMSSETAMNKNHGGMADYRSSEGRTVEIPYRGPVTTTVLNLLGGLRSACTYVGASQLKDLSRNTTFVRVGNQFNNVFT